MRTLTAIFALCAELGASVQQPPNRPYKPHAVRSPDGVMLAVQEWGNPSGPEILFIHGFAQSSLSWGRQVKSELAGRTSASSHSTCVDMATRISLLCTGSVSGQ